MKTIIGMAAVCLLCAGMVAGAGEWVSEGTFSSSSTYEPNTRGNVFDSGHWCGAQNGGDWIQLDFNQPEEVAAVTISRAGTDMSTEKGKIIVKLLGEDGRWIVVDELQDTNINYDELTGGNRGNSIPTYRKDFDPVVATAFRLEMFGHGWFRAEDIRIWRAGAEISTTEPAPEESKIETLQIELGQPPEIMSEEMVEQPAETPASIVMPK